MVKIALSSCRPINRVTFAADAHEIAVVDPLLLQEFDRGHRLGADQKKNGPARHFVIRFGQSIRIVRWSIRGAAPYEPMQVDVGQPSELFVARIHAANMASARSLAAFIILVFMTSSCVVSFLVSYAIEPSGRTFSAPFLLHPLPNIGRTILELDAISFGMPEKTDDMLIHEG